MSAVLEFRNCVDADVSWDSFFWNNGPIGMIQHDDFWDLVSQKVNIYRGDLSGTTANAIVLDDGRQVPTDVLLCGTGWNATSFFPPNRYTSLVCLTTLAKIPRKQDEAGMILWSRRTNRF